MDKITRIFIDTSKQFFQLHGVNGAEQVVLRRQLRRNQVLAFFAKLEPTVVGLEACGASHHWARELAALGHEVKLVPPQHVKAYLKRNKNDGRDAEAGCEAMSRPTMRFVPVKSAESQAALMLVGVRDRLIRGRTQLSNTLRGHAAEFGLVAPKGLAHIAPLLADIAADERVPELARGLFAGLAHEWDRLGEALKAIEAKLMAWHRQDAMSQRLANDGHRRGLRPHASAAGSTPQGRGLEITPAGTSDPGLGDAGTCKMRMRWCDRSIKRARHSELPNGLSKPCS